MIPKAWQRQSRALSPTRSAGARWLRSSPPGRPTDRNAARCRGSARCLQGCPTGGRRSTDVAYVPYALRRGARLHTGWRVRRVRLEHGRAVAVEGERLSRHEGRVIGRFSVRARRAVVLAAGAVHTAVILWRSGIAGPVGRYFQAHPGLPVVGRFEQPVRMGFGATQAYQVPLRERGFKLESLSLPPEMMASRLPGVGGAWQRRIAHLGHYAQWVAMIRMEAVGRIVPNPFGEPLVFYQPTERDLARTREAVALLCRMMFAAGAREVHTALWGVPETLTSVEQVRLVEQMPLRRGFYHYVASHLFGGAVAGRDAQRTVLRPDLSVRGCSGLYVLDAAALPTNLGVNPQHIFDELWDGALETQPVYHPISQLVYAAGREQVSDVWVAGQHLLKGRALTTLNQQAIVNKARQWGKKIQEADEHSAD